MWSVDKQNKPKQRIILCQLFYVALHWGNNDKKWQNWQSDRVLSDIILSKIIRLDTNTNDELDIVRAMKKLKLDFDDSMQFHVCQKNNLKIISYDKHFDKTPIKRFEPKDVKL